MRAKLEKLYPSQITPIPDPQTQTQRRRQTQIENLGDGVREPLPRYAFYIRRVVWVSESHPGATPGAHKATSTQVKEH